MIFEITSLLSIFQQNIKDFFLKYGSIQSVTVREGKRNDGSMIGYVLCTLYTTDLIKILSTISHY